MSPGCENFQTAEVMEKSRILLVEGDNIQALDLRLGLEKIGFEVAGVTANADDSVSLAQQEQPDLVLMDFKLGDGMDGIQAAAAIRSRLDVAVIFVCDSSDMETRGRIQQAGAYGILLKPFDERELVGSVEIALQTQRMQRALAQREAFYRALIENSSDIVVIVNQDAVVQYASPSCQRLLGYDPARLVGEFLGDYLHPDDQAEMVQELSRLLGGAQEMVSGLFRVRHADGSWRFFESHSHSHLDDPAIAGMVVSARDVTDRLQAEAALRESQERYSLAVEGANDGLWDWDLRTNHIYFSTRWKAILGYAEAEVGSRPEDWFQLVHPEDIGPLRMQLARHLAGEGAHLEMEHRMLRKDGGLAWVLCRGLAVRDASGVATRMAGSLSDISPRKQVEAQLVHDALHDALTGLPNRTLLIDRLGRAISHASRRSSYLFAVCFIDLNSFKLVNDSFGHGIGDKLLVSVGNMLSSKVRSADTVARLGGDEFVLLLDDLQNSTEVLLVAERILEGLSQPVIINGYNITTSGSIGIVMGGTRYTSPEDLLRDADIAMYRAKALGKARYVIFSPNMRTQVLTRLETERDLRRAMEHEEFLLHYQPILSLPEERVTGFEALIRWQHPTRGLLQPVDFLSVAEEAGLIVTIGRWVVRQACWQIRRWQESSPSEPPLSISVNLSVRQFETDALVSEIEDIMQEIKLPPFSLRLEITKSALLEQPEFALGVLTRLREKGVQIHVDNFGSGYSALSYLQSLPVSSIKIDRTFIQRLGTGQNEIIPSILALARDMGINAIAEGVETADQLNRLKAMHCPYVQGFFLSVPMDAERIGEALQAAGGKLPAG